MITVKQISVEGEICMSCDVNPVAYYVDVSGSFYYRNMKLCQLCMQLLVDALKRTESDCFRSIQIS